MQKMSLGVIICFAKLGQIMLLIGIVFFYAHKDPTVHVDADPHPNLSFIHAVKSDNL